LLLPALAALEGCPCVLRAGLTGDHLRAITPPKADVQAIQSALWQAGVKSVHMEQVEPTLEDVFLALASSKAESKG